MSEQVRRVIRPHQLRVKAKSLAAEARIIKQEEARALRLARKLEKAKRSSDNQRARWADLRNHRMDNVRNEARSTHIARGFLGGLKFTQIEQKHWAGPNWDRVRDMVKKYTGNSNVYAKELEDWITAGTNEVEVIDAAVRIARRVHNRIANPPRARMTRAEWEAANTKRRNEVESNKPLN